MDNQEFFHHTRHALVGIYAERKNLLNTMLYVAEALESKWRPKFLKSFAITNALKRQLTSIRRLDDHLERLHAAVLKEGRKIE